MKLKKQISIDSELYDRAKAEADESYMTMSGLISLSLNQYLIQKEIPKALSAVAYAMRKIADTNEITEEDRQQLQNFEILVKMLTEASGKI